MLYQISNGAVRFAADTILENINFQIKNTEKIAIVGRNGCGKTTLLRLITGEIPLSKLDSDEHIFITKSGNPVIGYLKQTTFEDDQITLEMEIRKVFEPLLKLQEKLEQLLLLMEDDSNESLIQQYSIAEERFQSLGGYEYQRECEIMLKQFGFLPEDFHKKISEFSGGQQTKIAFTKLLLSKPDILLLDEPTNHLDISAVEWLEGYLKAYNRAVVIVSHDRMFLDKIVNVVYEIEYKTSTRYSGNYSAFVKQKRLNWEKQWKDYTMQQKEIERLERLIEKFKHHPTKVSMARSKQKQIEHMIKIHAPNAYDKHAFHANFVPIRQSGTNVLTVHELSIGYDQLLTKLSFAIKKGQKLAIIGSNGKGKSTLLKTLIGAIPMLGGSFQYGYQVDIGYFDQQIAQHSSDKSILDDFWGIFPELTHTEARTILGFFLFTQDDVFKQVSVLSGGERARLALAKILTKRPNFLILDEPTNHMDIIGKETLEQMLSAYTGTLLFVSHDRYFVQQISDSLLFFDSEQVTYYPLSYKEYLAEKNEDKNDHFFKTISSKPTKSNYFGSNAGKESAKTERKLKRLEEQIQELEELLTIQKTEFTNPKFCTHYEKLSELQASIDSIEIQLDKLLYEWEELQSSNKSI